MEFNDTLIDMNFNDTCINDTSLYNTTTLDLPPCHIFKDPSYYALPYRVIGTIFQGFILIVGVLGNIMVIIVVTRTRGMKTPTNCYLVSLSMADLMVLLSAVPNEILSYYVLGEQWVWGQVGCSLFIFAQYLGINASSLSITAFTIERYIAICHPMKAQKMCTVHRAKNIITYVWIFAIIYCSPWLFLTVTKPVYYKGLTDIETCTFSLKREYYWGYFFADLVLFYILPLILSCILYSMIARILFTDNVSKSMNKSRKKEDKKRKKEKELLARRQESDLENGADDFGEDCQSNNLDKDVQNASNNDNHRSMNQSTDNARVQVVKMLVVVVAVFATLWLPYRALLVYNSFATHRYMELWYLMFCKTMIFVNSAINPILYNALSVKFRRAFKEMLSCGSSRESRSQRAATAIATYHSANQMVPLNNPSAQIVSSTGAVATTAITTTTVASSFTTEIGGMSSMKQQAGIRTSNPSCSLITTHGQPKEDVMQEHQV